MTSPPPTFSVEVLGFPNGADPEGLAGNLSAVFGISIEEGRRLVVKAPLRVKRNAPPDVTQKLVRQLRKLGADVLVRNELTGEERTYRVGDPSAPRNAAASSPDIAAPAAGDVVRPLVVNPDAPPPAAPRPSEDDPAPAETGPDVQVLMPGRDPISTPLPPESFPAISEKLDSPAADPDGRASSPSNPFESRAGAPGAAPLISL